MWGRFHLWTIFYGTGFNNSPLKRCVRVGPGALLFTLLSVCVCSPVILLLSAQLMTLSVCLSQLPPELRWELAAIARWLRSARRPRQHSLCCTPHMPGAAGCIGNTLPVYTHTHAHMHSSFLAPGVWFCAFLVFTPRLKSSRGSHSPNIKVTDASTHSESCNIHS